MSTTLSNAQYSLFSNYTHVYFYAVVRQIQHLQIFIRIQIANSGNRIIFEMKLT